MNQYLLFDLDGTLTDPKIGITTCVQYALSAQGIEEPDLNKLEPFIGPPLKDSFMEFYGFNEEQAERAIGKYRERFQDIGIFENKLYPGIRRMLRKCKRRGAALAVASSKPEIYVKRILEHFHLAQYFDVIVGSELDGRRTAKEEVVQEALRRLFPEGDIDYDNTVMIGDRKFDVTGARDNKLVGVGVSYGYGSMEELKAAAPDYIVRSVRELEELLLRGRDKGKEKAVIDWHKPTLPQKAGRIFFPILVYLVVSDGLRMLAAILAGKLSPYLPESWIYYDEAGKMSGLTGNASALVNALIFLLVFGILMFSMGRTDLIQEKFAHRVRNAGAGKDHETVFASQNSAGRSLRIRQLFRRLTEAILLLLLAAGAAIGCNFLFSLTGFAQTSQEFGQVSARQMTAGLACGLFLYGVCSPLAEELIFRGILFVRLKHYFPLTLSVIVSALLFGLYHGNTVQALYGFLAGCLLALYYHKSGSFLKTVTLHGLLNITGFLLSYWNLFASAFYGWKGCIAAFIVAAVSFLLLWKRKYTPGF